MADIALVVDEVRGFLLSYDQSLKPHIPDLARDYAGSCVEANKRLAKCQRLLQQGLRAEAIHLAKESPDLLEMIQALDFAERPAWLEIVQQYDLPIPPDFDATAIEFLQSAYVEDDPLRELMRSHRRLALLRAPLRQRIEVLRKLSEKDANNPIWATDVQTFEKARIEQIKEEAAEAKRLQDVASLGLLNDELSSKDWLAPPPKTLTRAVAQVLADFRQNQTRQDQAELVWAMQEAFSALDVDKAREIRARWQNLDGRSGETSINPLYGQVEPAFLWLDEVDRQEEEEGAYHQALVDLGDGLADRLPRIELEQLGEGVLRHGRGMPADLEARYRSRLDELTLATSRKRTLVIALIAVAVVLVCIVALVISWQWSQAVAARVAAQKVDEGLAAHRVGEARAYLDGIAKGRPFLTRHPALAGAAARLVAAEAAESERSARFERAIHQAEEGASGPTGEPPLELASAQAFTKEEKRRVQSLADRRLSTYRDQIARDDEEARSGLQTLSGKLTEMKQQLADPTTEAAVRTTLREVTSGLHDASVQIQQASDDVRALYQSVSSGSEEVRKELLLRDRRRDLQDQITRATLKTPTLADDYEKALAEAAKAMTGPRASDYRKALGEKPYWAAALAWADLCHGTRLAPARSEVPAEARAWADRCAAFLGEYPRAPDASLVEEARAHFEAITRRTEGTRNLRTRLNDLFSDYFFENAFITTVREPEGEFLYYSKEPAPMNSVTRLHVVVMDDLKGGTHNEYVLRKDVLYAGRAPQSLLAEDLKAALSRRPTLERWDAMMAGFASQVSENSGTDPLLKLSILRALLPLAGEGSRELARALEPSRKAIEASRAFGNPCWINPKDRVANEVRPKARLILESLPPWKDVESAAAQAQQEFAAKINAIPQSIGWLSKDTGWTCRMPVNARLPRSGELCVVAPGGSHGVWKTIGRLKEGRAEIALNDRDAGVEGRLVFVRADPARP